jgi:hypothetical protein
MGLSYFNLQQTQLQRNEFHDCPLASAWPSWFDRNKIDQSLSAKNQYCENNGYLWQGHP